MATEITNFQDLRSVIREAREVWAVVRLGHDVIHIRTTKAELLRAIRGMRGEFGADFSTATLDENNDLLVG